MARSKTFDKMFYVYVLVNKNKDKHYIGYTKDLKRRLKEHVSGGSYWSRRLESAELYYYEAYQTKELAQERERKLKQRGSANMGLIKRIGLK